jgi:hypothetical protein
MTDLTEVLARAMEPECDWDGAQLAEIPTYKLTEGTKNDLRASVARNKENALCKVRRQLAALDAAGYQIVPKEPTEEMWQAAVRDAATKAVDGMVAIASIHGCALPPLYSTRENSMLLRCYRAMLAAAPKP